jgi:four helix bundle protein
VSQIEYLRFLEIAFGSLKELYYQLILAGRLGYFGESEVKEYELNIIEREKVLFALIRALQ